MAALVLVTGMAFEAGIAAGAGVEVLYGLRGAALAQALAARLRLPCDGVISFGVAGGLAPSLPPGAVLVAARIVHEGRGIDTDPAWSAAIRLALPAASVGILAGVDAAVAGVADKQALHLGSGALAVDMESHLAARAAQAAQLPFAACRIVLDPAGRALPPAALVALGPDGRTDLGALLRALAADPRQLGGLLQLGRDAAAARAVLKTTRKLLGRRFALPAPG
ncbi:MAG TPA: phosphorylase [Janthinobacterium sp.]|jgi:hopanoid-associated phosphorylase|nr:phosphorylase [Janthinobacterium sp.]